MKAIVVLCWTYFTAFPIQRWLGVIAMPLFAIGLVAVALASPRAIVVAAPFALLFAFSVMFVCGLMFRILSAPRRHRLVPYFRLKMLLAVFASDGSTSTG